MSENGRGVFHPNVLSLEVRKDSSGWRMKRVSVSVLARAATAAAATTAVQGLCSLRASIFRRLRIVGCA